MEKEQDDKCELGGGRLEAGTLGIRSGIRPSASFDSLQFKNFVSVNFILLQFDSGTYQMVCWMVVERYRLVYLCT